MYAYVNTLLCAHTHVQTSMNVSIHTHTYTDIHIFILITYKCTYTKAHMDMYTRVYRSKLAHTHTLMHTQRKKKIYTDLHARSLAFKLHP